MSEEQQTSEDDVVQALVSTTFARDLTEALAEAVRQAVAAGMSTEEAVHAIVIGAQVAVGQTIHRAWGKDDDSHQMAHALLDICWEMTVPELALVEH